jgi:hypothetical protein
MLTQVGTHDLATARKVVGADRRRHDGETVIGIIA